MADPTGAITSYTYDSSHRLTAVKNSRGFTTNYAYNFAGRFKQSTRPDNTTNQLCASQMSGLVNSSCACPSAMSPNCVDCNPSSGTCGTASAPAPLVLTANVAAPFTDGRGNTTMYTTDRLGATASMKDPLTRTTTILRDGNSNPIRTTEPMGAVTIQSYDSRGNLLSVTDALNNVTRYTYEPSFNQVTSITDARGNTTTFKYHNGTTVTCGAMGALCQTIDALNNPTNFSYNAQGLLTSTTDALGNQTTYSYDAQGKLTTITDALSQQTLFTYDSARNVKTATVGKTNTVAGQMTTYNYDAMNRVTSVIDAANKTTSYAYVPVCNNNCGAGTSGLLAAITDANLHTMNFAYDARDRLTTVTNPLNQARSFGYDANSNLTSLTNARGQTITFGYDAVNRLTQKTVPVPGSPPRITTYSYDNGDNLTRVTAPDSDLALAYDLLHRVTSATTNPPNLPQNNQPMTVISYTYDTTGNRQTMTDCQGRVTQYGYDALNRLTGLTNPFSQSTTYGYDALSRRTQRTLANQVQSAWSYDRDSQLLSLTHQLATTTLSSFSYMYDTVGNRTSMTELAGPNNYTYDAVNRLLTATHPQVFNPPESYTYDPVGNRLTTATSAGTSCFDAANRLFYDGTFGYSYDADGNLSLTCIPFNGPPQSPCPPNWVLQQSNCAALTVSYTFDAENRLIQANLLPNNTTSTYTYDGLGRRIQKSDSVSTTRYIHDGSNILETCDGTNIFKLRFTQGLGVDEPISFDQLSNVAPSTFYLADALDSIRKLTSAAGAPIQSYTYDSFGNIVNIAQQTPNPAITQPFNFTGREWDSVTALYYYRARYYDPTIGRFLSEDPIGFDGGINFYTYVKNNPINFRDPSGTQAETLVLTTFCGPACWVAAGVIVVGTGIIVASTPEGRSELGRIGRRIADAIRRVAGRTQTTPPPKPPDNGDKDRKTRCMEALLNCFAYFGMQPEAFQAFLTNPTTCAPLTPDQTRCAQSGDRCFKSNLAVYFPHGIYVD